MTAPGILDSGNSFEIVKNEMFYDIDTNKNNNINSRGQLWFYNGGNFGRSFTGMNITARKPESKLIHRFNDKYKNRSIAKKHKNKKHIKHKIKKCFFKLFKGKRKKFFKTKKIIIFLFMALLVAKSLIIHIVLKILALIAAKGLIMGFFSTILGSVISLKGVLGHPYGHRNRRDEGKTRVEIFHVPGKHDNMYYERPFRRKRYDPFK